MYGRKKCVYIVYGIDCDIYDNYADVVGQPLFMFAFSTKEDTMKYLKGKCIEIAKGCMDVASPALMNIPEEKLFIDGTTSDIDENIHISYWENDNKAGWEVYVEKSELDDEDDDFDNDFDDDFGAEDYNFIFLRVYMKKNEIN